ncbi:MAG: FAD-binding protein [Lachnospiraceae bacterium]|nr:FAD-binding protein [Lachnospiraceae bacterium]
MDNKSFSRKDFLRGIAVGAAGVTATGLLPGLTWIVSAEEGAAYTPGTYSAAAQGINGDVTVTMTFDESSITEVIIDASGETAEIGGAAADELVSQIMSGQTAEIDGVSGATVTSNAVKKAATECIAETKGLDISALTEETETETETAAAASSDIHWPQCEPEYTPVAAGEGTVAYESDPIDESQITETVDVDVLVCGLGPAGFAAALSCIQHGLTTAAIEKNDTGTINSTTIGGVNDRIHEMYDITFDEDLLLGEAMTKNGYRANQALYKKLLETNGEAVNWWLDQMPFEDEEYKLTFFGYSGEEFPDFTDQYDVTSRDHSWNTSINIPFDSATEMREYLTSKIQVAGVDVRMETPVVQLITDDTGRVIGAYAKNESGYIRFNTSKGVILSTGGYEHNLKKLQECCRPRDLQLCGWLTYARNCTGDGHEMAKAIGAMEDEYPHSLMLDPMQLMPFVRVNSKGKRFVGEYETYDHLASAIQTQYGGYDFFITDANVAEAVDNMWSPSSSAYGPKETWAASATGGLTADSLEELAELMGVPSDTFVETINHWNEMCDAGEDSDFGYPGEYMHRIDTAPFYATKEMAEALTTTGGLQVNEYSQVLNTANEPIEGLYALGNTSGSMFYGTYPHSLNCLNHTRCIVFGYNVGKNLSEEIG